MRTIISTTDWTTESIHQISDWNAEEKGNEMHLLMSYYYIEKNDRLLSDFRELKKSGKKNFDFYLDSGVYSARKKGKIIPVDGLIKFYHNNSDWIDYVFTMDSGNREEQIEKFKIMSESEVPTIPIIHNYKKNGDMRDEDLFEMWKYTNLDDYFAMTLNQPGAGERIFEMLRREGLERSRCHLLGVEKITSLLKFPAYSSDASNVVRATITGSMSVFMEPLLAVKDVNIRRNWNKLILNNIDPLEWTVPVGVVDSRENFYGRLMHNVQIRYAYQKLITTIWEKRGIVWQ